jgi:hypothetical protein
MSCRAARDTINFEHDPSGTVEVMLRLEQMLDEPRGMDETDIAYCEKLYNRGTVLSVRDRECFDALEAAWLKAKA